MTSRYPWTILTLRLPLNLRRRSSTAGLIKSSLSSRPQMFPSPNALLPAPLRIYEPQLPPISRKGYPALRKQITLSCTADLKGLRYEQRFVKLTPPPYHLETYGVSKRNSSWSSTYFETDLASLPTGSSRLCRVKDSADTHQCRLPIFPLPDATRMRMK